MTNQHTLTTLGFARPERSLLRLLALVKLWHARSRSRACLWRAEDRILEDIGVTRIQAEAEARKYFWQA